MARQPKTDKQCAQAAVAAAMVTTDDKTCNQLIDATLTVDELLRAKAYLESDKPITGR
ncbi:hypothetical protein ACWCPT_29345 [Streptomyces sp. NPDC002308]